MRPGRYGPRPWGLGPLFVVYAATILGFVGGLFFVDWSADDPTPPSRHVEYATTEELQRALRHALARLPDRGAPDETARDRESRRVIEEGLAGNIVVVPTTVPEQAPPATQPPTTTTTTSTTTTTTPAPPTTDRPRLSVGQMADELLDDLAGGNDGSP